MTSSSTEKRVIHEVSDSDFEEFSSPKKAKVECPSCLISVDELDKKTLVCAQCASKAECPVCFLRVEESELVDCQAAKKSSASASHSVCIQCFSKLNKCPLCRSAYEPENKEPEYVPPSPILIEHDEAEFKAYEDIILYSEFKRKVESVGHSPRLAEIYPRVRERYLLRNPNLHYWPALLSSSSRYNFSFFQWVMDQEARVYGNPSMLHRVVDSNLAPEALQLVLNDEYKGLLQLQAVRNLHRSSMIERVLETWCGRSPAVLTQLVLWYRAADLARRLNPTELVRAGLFLVPWPKMAQLMQNLGLSLAHIDVTSVLVAPERLPPLETVKELGQLNPRAVWNCFKDLIEGRVGDKTGLSKEWLTMLSSIRPSLESVSLWTSGQYDAESFQRNALIRQVMPQAINTTMINLVDGKMAYDPLGAAQTDKNWSAWPPHALPKSNDFLFLSPESKQRAKITEAKLPNVAPSGKFVLVYYHNEYPRQYRVYVSIKSQGNMGLDKYIDTMCIPLPGTNGGRPFDGLLVPNAQFIVALKNKPRH